LWKNPDVWVNTIYALISRSLSLDSESKYSGLQRDILNSSYTHSTHLEVFFPHS
jgi:hypothetical protein